ncbi:C39 family peptidase [Candidatus Berkelbacteria bacterium]|nr:C39 family peptidase [Candidatus Berkelbacteria bacterium]
MLLIIKNCDTMIFKDFLGNNMELNEGKYEIQNVPFFSQRLHKGNYREEGFSTLKEAKYWSDRICGLACLKMILKAFRPELDITLKQLLDKGLELEAYKERSGWIHQGLVNIAAFFNVRGSRESIGQDVEKVWMHLSKGRLIVPSVTVGFEAGKEYKQEDGSVYTMPRGGHLVVVFGAEVAEGKVEKFKLHHPSSLETYEWPDHEVNRSTFLNSFSERGNIIYFEGEKS